jgi:hypothetical protein
VSENHRHANGDALPAELQRMHQRLLDDGVTWRAEFPPSATFRQGVEEFERAQAAQAVKPGAYQQHFREGDSMHNAPPLSPASISSRATRAKPRYLRGLLAVAATAIIAALFAVAFQVLSANGPAQRPHGLATAPSPGVWVNVGQFQSRNGERVMVAPSDPHVVYRLNSRTFAMERSVEGGGAWNTIALPTEVVRSAIKTYAVFDINPLNANIVYLTAFADASTSPSCPSPFLPGGVVKRDFSCSVQYVSTDGGAQWQRLMLPSQGRLTGMLTQVFGIPRAPLLAQDNRVYSLMTTNALTGEYRLVVSTDGVNWQITDNALAATGLRIESYMVSPTGSTVWVTMSDGSVWRSDDAGNSWARAFNLTQAQLPEGASLVATRTVAGKAFLYAATYSPPIGDIAPDGVRVSVDGGQTWQVAPVRGIPDGQHAAPYSSLARSDGTLVMLFRTPQMNIAFDEGILHSAAYYSWKPGDKSWTRLTPLFDAEAVQQQWITPANDARPLETIWALIYRDPTLTYVEDAYIKDGTYTISSVGLGS